MRGELEVQEVQIDTRIEAPGEGHCHEVQVVEKLLQNALDGLSDQKKLIEHLETTNQDLKDENAVLQTEMSFYEMPTWQVNQIIWGIRNPSVYPTPNQSPTSFITATTMPVSGSISGHGPGICEPVKKGSK